MAIVILLNFCLILFDLSYVPWRDFYFQSVPRLAQLYDPIKGIEPHRETQRYLHKVNELEAQVMQTGLQSPESEKLLQELRILSNEMIQDNPFAVANKTGTLAKIKQQMRDRVGKESAHEAFDIFWSQAYLAAKWQQEIQVFNVYTRPLIQSNYYRSIGISGKFTDNFWLVDSPFFALFCLEFLVRTFYISRRKPELTWLEAMLRRWYDVFLLLPLWRWLRAISVTIRLQQAQLLNLEPIKAQINRDFVTNFAEEVTEVVGVRLIDQAQAAVEQGSIARWLFHPETRRPYINVNNTDEIKALSSRLLQISVYQVLPKIQPHTEALLRHCIESTLNQSSMYRQIQSMPGINHLPDQLTEKLVTDISQTAYKTITSFLEDPIAIDLSNRLMQSFTTALAVELQDQQNLQEVQSLLSALLEEIKINYIKDIAQGGVEESLDEAAQLRHRVRQ